MMKKPSDRFRQLTTTGQLKTIDFRQILSLDRIVDFGDDVDKQRAIERLVEVASASEKVLDDDKFRDAIFRREAMMSTGVGNGVGVPHVKVADVRDFIMAVGRSKRGIDYGSQDGQPVHIIVLIGAHESQSGQFLTVVANLMQKLKAPKFRQNVMEAESHERIFELFVAEARTK